MGTPRVSVIVAAYNLQDVIEKSLLSVLNQTYQKFEIVVCDDCSTDGTYQILRQIAEQDDRVVLLRNETNSGQAYARNRCFSAARGEYFAIHDGDDFSVPDRLEKQASFLEAHPEYAFVSGLIRSLDDSGHLSLRAKGYPGRVEKKDFLWGLPFAHPATMFRGDAVRHVGGYKVSPYTRFRGEDYDMIMRMYAVGLEGYVLKDHVYNYFEGAEAYGRRKFRYRGAEAKVRYVNFKALGLMPLGMIFVLKPFVAGLFPQRLLMKIRQRNADREY